MSSGAGPEARAISSAPGDERVEPPLWRQWPVLVGLGVALCAVAAAVWIATQAGSGVESIAITPVGAEQSGGSLERSSKNPPSATAKAEVNAAKQRFTEYLALRDELYRDPSASMARVYDFAMGREIDVMGGTLAAARRVDASFQGGRTEANWRSVDDARLDEESPALELVACLEPIDMVEHRAGKPYVEPTGYYGPYLADISMTKVDEMWFVVNTYLGEKALRPC